MWSIELLIVLCISNTLASPLLKSPHQLLKKQPSLKASEPQDYKLNSGVIPHYYFLNITPYFDTGDNKSFTFDGEVVILIRNEKSNNTQIKLHASELNITAEDVMVINFAGSQLEKDKERPIEFDVKRDFLIINMAEGLQNETGYLIVISYSGIIGDSRKGFYKSAYIENGTKKWVGATQFQPTRARKAFPCFDEPEFKAVFVLTIVRPKGFKPSLSNMPINATEILDDNIIETFNPTPIMSTYLLAFVVSEFSSTDGDRLTEPGDVEVWSRTDVAKYGNYSKGAAFEIIEAMIHLTHINFFDVDDFMKMDQVALPDSTGAMENWGLVTYGEVTLLYDEMSSSAMDKLNVFITMAHELAHMWFGNLVTCQWWSYTWLNEGFATYFEFVAAHLVDPSFGMDVEFVVDAVHLALVDDALKNSPPLSDESVYTPEDVSGHFGTITYKKGGSVFRMMEHLLGRNTFLKGLNYYINSRKFQNAKPSHLYEALQKAADIDGALESYSQEVTVEKFMKTWVSQAGYPLVTVTSQNNMTYLKQERFYREKDTISNELYEIPITISSSNHKDFNITKPMFIFNEKTTSFKYEHSNDWVLINTQQTGWYSFRPLVDSFYRINYDDSLWDRITAMLNDDYQRKLIHPLNKAQIVDDLFAFAYSERLDYVTLFERISFLSKETEYAPWMPALKNLETLRKDFLISEKDLKLFDRYMLELMDELIKSVSFLESPNETQLQKRFRTKALRLACKVGHRECIGTSMFLYDQLKNDNISLSPDTRTWVYCAALKSGKETDFNFLFDMYYEETMQHAESNILEALGCSSNEENINLFLMKSIEGNSHKRPRFYSKMFLSVISGNNHNIGVALHFLQLYFRQMKAQYGTIGDSIISFANIMYTNDQLDILQNVISNNAPDLMDVVEDALHAVDHSRNAIKKAIQMREKLVPWLEAKLSKLK